MKWFFIVLMFSLNAYSETTKPEYVSINSFKAEVYNSIVQKRIRTNITTTATVSTENAISELSICNVSSIYEGCYDFHADNLAKFLELIEKFKEWNAKATKNKDSFQKEIGKIDVKSGYFFLAKSPHQADIEPESITLTFFSLSKSKHMLVIDFPKLFSKKNKFTTSPAESIYFDEIGIKALTDATSESFLKAKASEHFKKKAKTNSEYK